MIALVDLPMSLANVIRSKPTMWRICSRSAPVVIDPTMYCLIASAIISLIKTSDGDSENDLAIIEL